MQKITFNHAVDHGENMGYEQIIYVNKKDEHLSFDEWKKIDFDTLTGEGHFLLEP